MFAVVTEGQVIAQGNADQALEAIRRAQREGWAIEVASFSEDERRWVPVCLPSQERIN